MAEKKEQMMKVTALINIIYDGKKHTKDSGAFLVPIKMGESWTRRDKPIAKEVK